MLNHGQDLVRILKKSHFLGIRSFNTCVDFLRVIVAWIWAFFRLKSTQLLIYQPSVWATKTAKKVEIFIIYWKFFDIEQLVSLFVSSSWPQLVCMHHFYNHKPLINKNMCLRVLIIEALMLTWYNTSSWTNLIKK